MRGPPVHDPHVAALRRPDAGPGVPPARTIVAMGYLTLSLLFVLFVLALLPTRRLWVAGASLEWRVGYLVALLALGLAAIEFEALGRYILPVLLLLYLVPFSGFPAWWQRARRRGAGPSVVEGHAVRLDTEDRPR